MSEASKRCGACRLWMTKECPREMPNKGPSFIDFPCVKFAWDARPVRAFREEPDDE